MKIPGRTCGRCRAWWVGGYHPSCLSRERHRRAPGANHRRSRVCQWRVSVISWKITGAPTTLFQDIGEDPVPNAQFSRAIILWYEMSIPGRQNRQLRSSGRVRCRGDAWRRTGAAQCPGIGCGCLGALVLRLIGVPLSVDCPLVKIPAPELNSRRPAWTTHARHAQDGIHSSSMNPTSPDRGFCILRCTATPKRVTDPPRKQGWSLALQRGVDHPFPLRRISAKPSSPAQRAQARQRQRALMVGHPAPTLPLTHLVYSRGRELLLDVPTA